MVMAEKIYSLDFFCHNHQSPLGINMAARSIRHNAHAGK